MRGTRPRNLKEMLVEAKNTSEPMADLSYALRGGDALLVTGAPEGLEPLAALFGQELEELA